MGNVSGNTGEIRGGSWWLDEIVFSCIHVLKNKEICWHKNCEWFEFSQKVSQEISEQNKEKVVYHISISK